VVNDENYKCNCYTGQHSFGSSNLLLKKGGFTSVCVALFCIFVRNRVFVTVVVAILILAIVNNQNQYVNIKADETRGIQALENLVVFAVKD